MELVWLKDAHCVRLAALEMGLRRGLGAASPYRLSLHAHAIETLFVQDKVKVEDHGGIAVPK